MPYGFVAYLMYGHCGHAALRTIADLNGKGLTPMGANGHRLEYEGCHRDGHAKCSQGLHQERLIGRVDKPGASLYAEVAGPIVPMGIGGVKYVLLWLMNGHVSHGLSR